MRVAFYGNGLSAATPIPAFPRAGEGVELRRAIRFVWIVESATFSLMRYRFINGVNYPLIGAMIFCLIDQSTLRYSPKHHTAYR
jgi:hypothetical protein